MRRISLSRVIPALLTRMSTRPNRSTTAPTSRSTSAVTLSISLDRGCLTLEVRFDLGAQSIGRGRTLAIVDRDVCTFGGEFPGNGPADPARRARDQRYLSRRARRRQNVQY